MVTTTYDTAGQPYSLQGDTAYMVSATYGALGQVTGLGFGNGVLATYTYRPGDFRLQRMQVGSSILDRQYGYDAVGNITATVDALSGGSLSYTYDPLDRLTGVSGALSEAYSYDPVGDLTSKAGVTYNYTDMLRKHAVSALSDGSFQYDAHGNMTRRIEGGVVYTQSWDVDNCLVSVMVGTQTTAYFYDANGALVRKVELRGQTLYGNADYLVFTATLATVMVPSTFTRKLYLPVAFGASTGACQGTCTYYRFNGQQMAVRAADYGHMSLSSSNKPYRIRFVTASRHPAVSFSSGSCGFGGAYVRACHFQPAHRRRACPSGRIWKQRCPYS